jgi:filamentous hemagglutinin
MGALEAVGAGAYGAARMGALARGMGAGGEIAPPLYAPPTSELVVRVPTVDLVPPVAGKSGTAIGREIKLVDGFYQAEGSAFKFSEYYYNKLWSTGRGAPFLQAEEVLNTAKMVTPDRMAGFNRYVNDVFEMIYNPTTKEVWHLQPLGK